MRKRSHWAWGWEDKMPSVEARENLGQMASAMLGFQAAAPREPVALEDVKLSTPRIAPPSVLSTFCEATDDSRIRHSKGRSYPDLVSGFYGDFNNTPDFVATPNTENDVVAILDWADSKNVAVVPFGGGTTVVGGVSTAIEGFDGVVTLDTSHLNKVLEIDDISRAARIQAGIFGPQLEEALRPAGFTMRHFPQSFEFSTLGGWLVTRSGGHFATVKTHIDDFVESTRTVTPNGILETRRLPASGAGPSPDRLILGSEGILGVVTEAWMRIQPRPTHRSQASFLFSDYDDAVAAIRELAQSGLEPANCRLLDRREAALNSVVFDGSHVLIVGFESIHGPRHAWMEQAEGICLSHGAKCPNGVSHRDSSHATEDAAGKWRSAFFDGPYLQSALVTMSVIADTFETACTWQDFPEFHAGIVSRMRAAMKEICGGGFISCRFTHVYPDGPAPYYTYLAPTRFGSELSQWQELKAAAMEAVVGLGGTITHHHSVGRLHLPGYVEQRPHLFAQMLRGAKGAVDPNGILNPGVLLERST